MFSAGSSDEVETNTLVTDPDFSSCGMGWLDMNDSCHRSIQIELQRAKCRRDEAYVKLLRTPSTACSKKTTAKEFDHTCHQVESLQAELGRYMKLKALSTSDTLDPVLISFRRLDRELGTFN